MSTTNYKMIGKLESGNWTAWVAKNTPDYTGASYSGGGTLITDTIQVSANYLDVADYYYIMIGKLTTGEWAIWGSFYSADHLGIYYRGSGTLIQETIQVSRFYEYTGVPPIFINEYSLLFDGTDEYVGMENILDFNALNAFSISAWFKTNSSGWIVSKFDITPKGWGIRSLSDKLDFLFFYDTTYEISISTTSSFNDNNWHHIIATTNGNSLASGMNIYVDGNNQEIVINYNNLLYYNIANSGSLNIGSRSNGEACFEGNIDEVSIYNKELSLSEVQAIYNLGVPKDLSTLPTSSNLLAWWRCGDGDIYPTILDNAFDYQFPIIPDSSTNVYNGTATNMEVSDIQFNTPGSQALVFGGTNEYVSMGNVLGFEYTDSFSYCFWIKTNTTSNFILSKMDDTARGYGIYVTSLGIIQIVLANTNSNRILVQSSNVINNRIWNHIVITYDGTGVANSISCYINNVSESLTILSDNLNSNTILNSTSFNISGRNNGTLPLVGSMGDVAIWDKEITPTEVSEIYNNKIPINLTTVSCAANLAAWWRCGERYSLAANGVPDFSGNGLHGTQANMEITDVESRTHIGNSMAFGGTNEFVDMGDVLGFERTDAFSYSFWLKTTAITGYSLSKMEGTPNYSGYGINLLTGGFLRIHFISIDATNRLTVDTTNSVSNGAWHHILVTYDGSATPAGVMCYIDGVSSSLTTVQNNLSGSMLTTASFNISGRSDGGALLLTGSLDDVSIWDKELSLSEVEAIYNAGIPTDLTGSANLVGYWKMGDGVGFNGTMTNMESGDIVADVP